MPALLQTKFFSPFCAKFIEQDQIPGFGLTSLVFIYYPAGLTVFSSGMSPVQACIGDSLNFYPFKQLSERLNAFGN